MDIHFYVLPGLENEKQRLGVACHLIESLYQSGEELWVNLTNVSKAEEFNKQLWTFKDLSFVPHQMMHGENLEAPVILGWEYRVLAKKKSFFNLAWLLPGIDFVWGEFLQIFDLVGEEDKRMARERYRFYRTLGNLHTHTKVI